MNQKDVAMSSLTSSSSGVRVPCTLGHQVIKSSFYAGMSNNLDSGKKYNLITLLLGVCL